MESIKGKLFFFAVEKKGFKRITQSQAEDKECDQSETIRCEPLYAGIETYNNPQCIKSTLKRS